MSNFTTTIEVEIDGVENMADPTLTSSADLAEAICDEAEKFADVGETEVIEVRRVEEDEQ